MDDKFLQRLSQNFLRILDDDEYFDTIIEVGGGDVRIFRAHMVILIYRSTYLKRILSTNKKKSDGNLVQINLPNILPEIFQIILRYIYGGTLSLEDYDALDIVKILVAAGELNLHELIVYIQSYLINNKADWMGQNFNLIYQASFENGSFLDLQEYCTELISRIPDKIFKSLHLPSVPEKLLISLIKNNNLRMSEIQIWEKVLKWGLAQNPGLSSDPSNYSKNDFNSLKNTLHQCIPFVRFFNLTSKEFTDRVLPYKEVLPEELFMNLLKSFLNLHPDSKLNNKSNPRMAKKTHCSVSFLIPPSTSYYPASTSTDFDSQIQNINKDKEVTYPLTTQIQPLPKNPNCNEEKVSPIKSGERLLTTQLQPSPKDPNRNVEVSSNKSGERPLTTQLQPLLKNPNFNEEKVSPSKSGERPLTTQLQPLLKNPNYNEEKVTSNKSYERPLTTKIQPLPKNPNRNVSLNERPLTTQIQPLPKNPNFNEDKISPNKFEEHPLTTQLQPLPKDPSRNEDLSPSKSSECPLTTQTQPSPKNSNYNEEKVSPNKSSERPLITQSHPLHKNPNRSEEEVSPSKSSKRPLTPQIQPLHKNPNRSEEEVSPSKSSKRPLTTQIQPLHKNPNRSEEEVSPNKYSERPLATQIQPLPKNSNCDEDKVSLNKSSERHLTTRKQQFHKNPNYNEEKVPSNKSSEHPLTTQKQPLHKNPNYNEEKVSSNKSSERPLTTHKQPLHKNPNRSEEEVSLNERPLTTQKQPLHKNPNYNEKKVSPNKSSERYHIKGRGIEEKAPNLNSRFIEDVNIPDGTILAPQTQFIKIWKMSNNGCIPWPDRTVLRCLGDDNTFNRVTKTPVGSVGVGENVDISVNIQAPSKLGKYMSFWILTDDVGNQFGSKVWYDITVEDAE